MYYRRRTPALNAQLMQRARGHQVVHQRAVLHRQRAAAMDCQRQAQAHAHMAYREHLVEFHRQVAAIKQDVEQELMQCRVQPFTSHGNYTRGYTRGYGVRSRRSNLNYYY